MRRHGFGLENRFIHEFEKVNVDIVPADIVVAIKFNQSSAAHIHGLYRTGKSLESSQFRAVIVDDDKLVSVNSFKVFNVFEDHGCFRFLMGDSSR